jgi:hypothetical protein
VDKTVRDKGLPAEVICISAQLRLHVLVQDICCGALRRCLNGQGYASRWNSAIILPRQPCEKATPAADD